MIFCFAFLLLFFSSFIYCMNIYKTTGGGGEKRFSFPKLTSNEQTCQFELGHANPQCLWQNINIFLGECTEINKK